MGGNPAESGVAPPEGEAEQVSDNNVWGVEKPDLAGVFVPYDKKLPSKPGVRFYTASGNQECRLCLHILEEGDDYGFNYYDLCEDVAPDMKPMCEAQRKTLQACPEFMNQWCYQDLGGTQQLRAPCPGHLVCHYCLGLNPLHCLENERGMPHDN